MKGLLLQNISPLGLQRLHATIYAHCYKPLEWLKNKIFKQGIGIAEKNLETRRDCWGGNVNPKSLF